MDSGDEGYGYIQRIEALISHATSHNGYPISAEGWKVGEACSDDGECISGFFDETKCKELLGSCKSCYEDDDCASVTAILVGVTGSSASLRCRMEHFARKTLTASQ
eukprot:2895763-Ditylum_brightwellii.AAC.1